MIVISIDVTLLEKERFKEVTRRNGDKAKFCELVLIETPNSEHGDFIVKQGVSKEEREAKIEMPILGNGKSTGGKPQQRQRQEPRQRPSTGQEGYQRRDRVAQPPDRRQQQQDPDLDAPFDNDCPF